MVKRGEPVNDDQYVTLRGIHRHAMMVWSR
jgi:hypothetical protein